MAAQAIPAAPAATTGKPAAPEELAAEQVVEAGSEAFGTALAQVLGAAKAAASKTLIAGRALPRGSSHSPARDKAVNGAGHKGTAKDGPQKARTATVSAAPTIAAAVAAEAVPVAVAAIAPQVAVAAAAAPHTSTTEDTVAGAQAPNPAGAEQAHDAAHPAQWTQPSSPPAKHETTSSAPESVALTSTRPEAAAVALTTEPTTRTNGSSTTLHTVIARAAAHAAEASTAAQLQSGPHEGSTGTGADTATPQPNATPATQPSATPVTQSATLVVRSSIENLPSVAEAAIQTSARTGSGRARIDLRPPELGHVEIDLRYTSDGVHATVSASSPQAAQALGASAGDLKRALEAHGLNVLGLDVSQTGTGDNPRPDGNANEGDPGDSPSSYGIDEDDDEATTQAAGVRVPSEGTSVDVLV